MAKKKRRPRPNWRNLREAVTRRPQPQPPLEEKPEDVQADLRERARDRWEHPPLTNPWGHWWPTWNASDRAWFPRWGMETEEERREREAWVERKRKERERGGA